MVDEPTALIEPAEQTQAPQLVEDVLVEDVLVEEVSIDGMCGVY